MDATTRAIQVRKRGISMTREEQLSNGFTDMMKGFWKNQDLEVPNLETLKSKMTSEKRTTGNQEPCDDAISRQAAIDTIESWLSCDDYNESERHIMRAMQSVLYDLPSVTPQPKIGHWIEEINDYGEVTGWHCDKCYEDSGFTTTCKWDFCPNCGAKMQEVEVKKHEKP